MQTLTDFIKKARLPQSAEINHPGWNRLYVRRSKVRIGSDFIEVFVLANIEAEKPGNGSFQELLRELPEDVVVECVHNERFAIKLEREGWIRVGDGFSFYKRITND